MSWPYAYAAHNPYPPRRAVRYAAWAFELKLDGFRGMADTLNSRMLSKNGKRLKRFEPLLDSLPSGLLSSHG